MDVVELRERAPKWEQEAVEDLAGIQAAVSRARALVDAGDAAGAASELIGIENSLSYLEHSTHMLEQAASWCAKQGSAPRIVKLPPR